MKKDNLIPFKYKTIFSRKNIVKKIMIFKFISLLTSLIWLGQLSYLLITRNYNKTFNMTFIILLLIDICSMIYINILKLKAKKYKNNRVYSTEYLNDMINYTNAFSTGSFIGKPEHPDNK